MTKDKMINILKENVVNVSFIKTDGTLRKMEATLMPEHLPVDQKTDKVKKRKETPEVLALFDLELKEWRSLRVKNITELQIEI